MSSKNEIGNQLKYLAAYRNIVREKQNFIRVQEIEQARTSIADIESKYQFYIAKKINDTEQNKAAGSMFVVLSTLVRKVKRQNFDKLVKFSTRRNNQIKILATKMISYKLEQNTLKEKKVVFAVLRKNQQKKGAVNLLMRFWQHKKMKELFKKFKKRTEQSHTFLHQISSILHHGVQEELGDFLQRSEQSTSDVHHKVKDPKEINIYIKNLQQRLFEKQSQIHELKTSISNYQNNLNRLIQKTQQRTISPITPQQLNIKKILSQHSVSENSVRKSVSEAQDQDQPSRINETKVQQQMLSKFMREVFELRQKMDIARQMCGQLQKKIPNNPQIGSLTKQIILSLMPQDMITGQIQN